MSAHVAMVLVDVSLLDKTDAESPVDIFLSTSQKRSKNTCRYKKSSKEAQMNATKI